MGYCFIHAEAMRRPEPRVRQYVPAPYFYFIEAKLGNGEAMVFVMRKFLSLGVLFVALLGTSCQEDPYVSIYGDTQYACGSTFQLNAVVTCDPASDEWFSEYYWYSSDESVVRVLDPRAGCFYASSEGEADVCVNAISVSGTRVQGVHRIRVIDIIVNSLELNHVECQLFPGDSVKLTATYVPENASLPELLWSSSNDEVATVDSCGMVRVVNVGESVITVKEKRSGVATQCKIVVSPIEITSIVCAEEIEMEYYEEFYLEASVSPMNATIHDNTLRWHSSDESVAVVDEFSGKVFCSGIGECTITISNVYNSVTSSCHLKVLPAVIRELSFDESSYYLRMGYSNRLHCNIYPDYANNKELLWESSNNSVVTVTEDGVITSVGRGVATIKVTALDGSGCTAECTIISFEESSLEDHVENYLNTKLSITTPMIIGDACSYLVKNVGDETVSITSIEYKQSSSITIYESLYIELGPGEEWEKFVSFRGMTLYVSMYDLLYYFTLR